MGGSAAEAGGAPVTTKDADANASESGAGGRSFDWLDARVDGPARKADGSTRCHASLVFGDPRLQQLRSDLADSWGSITLSSDGLEAYAIGSDSNHPDLPPVLYRLTRTTETGTFGDPESVKDLVGAPLNAYDPALSPDGLTLYYVIAVVSPAIGDLGNIYVSTRRSPSERFVAGKLFTALVTPSAETDPFVSRDGTMLYFDTSRDGDFELYSFPIGEPATPTPISVSSRKDEMAPVLTDDDLTIFFASNRDGRTRKDLYAATRASKLNGFGEARRIDHLSKEADEYPDAVSHDGCTLWYTANALGLSQIFTAVRGEP
jgi:hypothetical protein